MLAIVIAPLPALAISAPAPTPSVSAPGKSGALSPRLVIEKGRLEKMERLAHDSNPGLKAIEDQTLTLTVMLHKKQQESREAIDKYLKDHKLKPEDLPNFKLSEATDLLMKIQPCQTVSDPQMKDVVLGALKHGAPVYPADFAKQFPGRKPAQVPDDDLLAFYQTHLRTEALAAAPKLAALVKEAKIPDFMMKSMRELTRMKCMLIVYRNYITAVTPPDLIKQRRLVADLSK